MYKSVNAEEMLSAIDSGWYPAWFAIENSTLTVDLCVNYRLTDGKLLFLQFYSTDPIELSRVAKEVAQRAKEAWVTELDRMASNIDEDIKIVIDTEANIASVNWVEGQKYLMTFYDGEQETYECTVACDSDIYIKKILKPEESFLALLNNEQNVRDIVGSCTKVKMMD